MARNPNLRSLHIDVPNHERIRWDMMCAIEQINVTNKIRSLMNGAADVTLGNIGLENYGYPDADEAVKEC